MQCAGFVLAGGGSRRMGRDKALLPWRGSTLIQFVAGQVLNAAGSVTLIGNPDGLAGLGYPVIGDLHPGCGPLGGLETALRQGQSAWTLITACDMPQLTVASLRLLLDGTGEVPRDRGCFVAWSGSRRHPLCAVYHASCLPLVEQARSLNSLKMLDLLEKLCPVCVSVDAAAVANVNTPAEWDEVRAATQ